MANYLIVCHDTPSGTSGLRSDIGVAILYILDRLRIAQTAVLRFVYN